MLNRGTMRWFLQNCWIFGYLDIWIFGYLDTWIFGYFDILIFGYLDIWFDYLICCIAIIKIFGYWMNC